MERPPVEQTEPINIIIKRVVSGINKERVNPERRERLDSQLRFCLRGEKEELNTKSGRRELAANFIEERQGEGWSYDEIIESANSVLSSLRKNKKEGLVSFEDYDKRKRFCLSLIGMARYRKAVELLSASGYLPERKDAASVSKRIKELRETGMTERDLLLAAMKREIEINIEEIAEEIKLPLSKVGKVVKEMGRSIRGSIKRGVLRKAVQAILLSLFLLGISPELDFSTELVVSPPGIVLKEVPENLGRQSSLGVRTLAEERPPLLEKHEPKNPKAPLETEEPEEIKTGETQSPPKSQEQPLETQKQQPETKKQPSSPEADIKREELPPSLGVKKADKKVNEVNISEGEISEQDNIMFGDEFWRLPEGNYEANNHIKVGGIRIHWDAQQGRDPKVTFNALVGRSKEEGRPLAVHFVVFPEGVVQFLWMGECYVQQGYTSDGPSPYVEIETTGVYYDENPPPEEQTRNLVNLTIRILKQYNLKFNQIYGHLERTTVGKIDPGIEYLRDVRVRVAEELIRRGEWDILGPPETWVFWKEGKNGKRGEITQTPEMIIGRLSPEARKILFERYPYLK